MAALSAQPASRFEAASIKPTPSDQWNGTSGGASRNGRFSMRNRTLKRYLMGAYGLGPNQIAGAPEWLDSERFDIEATAGLSASDSEMMLMLQTLLAERCKLASHRETRAVGAYALVAAKGGPKPEKAQDGESSTNNSRGFIDARVITMPRFAEVLSRQLDYPVVDQTGLQGSFNVKLEWSPGPVAATDSKPSIFTAIQQLGLRLQARKLPVEVLVIDHVERPTEN